MQLGTPVHGEAHSAAPAQRQFAQVSRSGCRLPLARGTLQLAPALVPGSCDSQGAEAFGLQHSEALQRPH